MRLTKHQKDLITFALNMRICYIETGTITWRATEAVAQNSAIGKKLRPGQKRIEVKALDRSQRDLINGMEDIITGLQSD